MRRFVLIIALFVTAAGQSRADFIFSDVQNWTGTGSNEAVLVIDFSNGTSLAWGYRWNGSATGEQMLRAITASPNSGLYAALDYFDGYGYSAGGFGYDANRNGVFGTSPPLTFVNGISASTGDASRTATDPGDLYTEADGFPNYSSYWAYFTSNDPNRVGGWTYSGVGMTNRPLSNGSWDAWSFVPDSNVYPVPDPAEPSAAPAAVPEPGTLVLVTLTMGIAVVFVRARRRRITAIA